MLSSHAEHSALVIHRRAHGPVGYQQVKRVMDVALVLLVFPLVLVVILVCALVVRLDSPGGVIFWQMRTGRDGNQFKLYKFRSMVQDAENLKAGLAHLNVLPFPDFKIPDDPRVTRVGRFLRQTSLDELPQLWNVLRGEMTLVGPRPTSFGANTYELWHTRRLEVRPGITGLWQVTARNGSTFDQRLRLDLAYIESASLGTDLRILAATVGAVSGRSGE
ncbi:MAG: sugar transferase [Acidimicrobiia bacterium]|nr:sugar transferase [Acidimicrobiia bacterium]